MTMTPETWLIRDGEVKEVAANMGDIDNSPSFARTTQGPFRECRS